MKTTKTILFAVLLAGAIPVARAQDAVGAIVPVLDSQVPALVYQAPVVYAASVIYQAPVVYNAPVYYVAPATIAPVIAPACEAGNAPSPSTVVYIGGGSVRYQSAYCNSGSTVTYIGGGSRF